MSLCYYGTSPYPNCTCPDGDCTCRNIFGSPCGSLQVPVVELHIEAQNVQYVSGWLQTLGIQDIQTLLGGLAILFRGPGNSVSWTVDIFPQLEAVQSALVFVTETNNTSDFGLSLLPGRGFYNLRALGTIS
jgi:hypothetical protein